jgi:hypothetical protein
VVVVAAAFFLFGSFSFFVEGCGNVENGSKEFEFGCGIRHGEKVV